MPLTLLSCQAHLRGLRKREKHLAVLSGGRIETRIQREPLLSFQLVSSRCTSRVEQEVPALASDLTRDDDEQVLFQQLTPKELLSAPSATLASTIPRWVPGVNHPAVGTSSGITRARL
jgi:hypothetical protein